MTRILERVIGKLDREKPGTAVRILGFFISEVEAFVAAGILSPVEGQALIDAAQAITEAIGA